MAKEKLKVKKVIDIPETMYSRSEILGAASSFGVKPEMLAGALRLSEKKELTRSEVEDLLRKFKTRKV